eukprot:TRINITY_DN7180_c4_g1_i1.p1 TRINITY_DN7180_c4_g1~~TRINITY_DN7180_c4_g1_i1.p1  ORF type:complete len:130 (+),score=14.42 TRINITY_DN7180_c4_g1_i1:85-474(+)
MFFHKRSKICTLLSSTIPSFSFLSTMFTAIVVDISLCLVSRNSQTSLCSRPSKFCHMEGLEKVILCNQSSDLSPQAYIHTAFIDDPDNEKSTSTFFLLLGEEQFNGLKKWCMFALSSMGVCNAYCMYIC